GSQQLANRIQDVSHVEVAGSDFVQHRGEEEKVLPIHQGHVDVRIAGERFLKLERSIDPAEPTAKDHDVLSSRPDLTRLVVMTLVHSGDHACNRSSRWSPTRRAFGIIASDGFTALLETKKLASTT